MSTEIWTLVGKGDITEYNSPEELWNKSEEYFLWCDMNPIVSKRTLQSGKEAGKKVQLEHTRPYTIKGFCLFCGVNEDWIRDISSLGDKTNIWHIVIEKIMYIIYNQNMEGAYVDIFNPIMVSKVLGLDKPEQEKTRSTKIEILDSTSSKLANSENEILQNLNQEKMQIVKDKSENLQKINGEINSHKDSGLDEDRPNVEV